MSDPKPANPTASFVTGLVVIALAASIIYVATRRPDPNETCRTATRQAYSALVSDHPTMTKNQAQEVVYKACKGVAPADRKVIVDGERDDAIERYLTKRASPSTAAPTTTRSTSHD